MFFNEVLDSSLSPSITITGTILGTVSSGITATFSGHSNLSDNAIVLTGFGTIYSAQSEAVTLSYSSGVKDLAGNEWSPSNSSSISVDNNSSQSNDNTGPSISNITYSKDSSMENGTMTICRLNLNLQIL